MTRFKFGLSELGTIVHVRVDGIRLKNCAGGPEPDTIEHMPFTRKAIDLSVTKLKEESGKVPEFQSGYDTWLADCGVVYTLTVAQAVQADEDTFNIKRTCL